MTMPPVPMERPPMTTDGRRRRRRGWLAVAGGLLLLFALALAYSTQVWLARRAFDRAAQAALDRQPIVNGHLGNLRRAERAATPEQDRRIHDAVSYRLQGEAGAGVVTLRFDTANAAHPRIVQGVLRTDDGIAYPLTEANQDAEATQTAAPDDDPLRPRVEYQRNAELSKEYPNIIVDIDSSSRSDLQLIQYARRQLIAPLARIDGVLCIWSMGTHMAHPSPRLQVDRVRLAALKLSAQDVRDFLLAKHFRLLSTSAESETYRWPDVTQWPDALAESHSPDDLLSSWSIPSAAATSVPLTQIASIRWSTDTPRQAIGLVTSREDRQRVVEQVRAAMAKQASPDIQLGMP